MLARRLRRQTNIQPTLGQCLYMADGSTWRASHHVLYKLAAAREMKLIESSGDLLHGHSVSSSILGLTLAGQTVEWMTCHSQRAGYIAVQKKTACPQGNV